MDTLSDAIRRLQADGYTGNWFANADHNLECNESGRGARPGRGRRSTTSCASRASPIPAT